jgi:hypothetical protein
MSDIALVLEESIEVEVGPTFAWNYRAEVSNWNNPPATFMLNGPFAAGSQGETPVPEQSPWVWWIRDVHTGRSFATEMALDRAMLRFEWLLGAGTRGTTKLTQRIILWGDNAAAYRDQVETGFGSTLADGMKRIAEEMVAADRESKNAG